MAVWRGIALPLVALLACANGASPVSTPTRIAQQAATAPIRSSVRLPDGRALSFLHWDAPGRPKVLLLHGKGGFASGFADLAAHWQGHFDLYAIDMAGRGFSDWMKNGDYSAESAIADVDAFAALAGLDRFGIYGESYGAVVALGYGASHAGRVRFVILDDGGPVDLPDGAAPPLNPGQAAAAGSAAPRPAAQHFADWSAAQAWQARTCHHFCTPAQLESQFLRTHDGVVERSDVMGLWASPRGAAFEHQWGAVRSITVPTFLIRAERGLLPQAIARQMAALNPLIHYVSVAGAAHTVHGTQPVAAFAAADRFLLTLPPDG